MSMSQLLLAGCAPGFSITANRTFANIHQRPEFHQVPQAVYKISPVLGIRRSGNGSPA